ncbi:TPA: hypothetical protein EYP66_19950 [Candidatus Poribacteria bacterium]|nr:hypothetical protein [Candidatus Poribacteria bacterium]
MYTHPCRLFTDTFRFGNNPPREKWSPAPLRPPEEIAEIQTDFDAFLQFVVKQPNIELTTYRELYSEYRPAAEMWLSRGEKLDHLKLDGDYISPAEQFGFIAWVLSWLDEHNELPKVIPVRRLPGPKEKFPLPIYSQPSARSTSSAPKPALCLLALS